MPVSSKASATAVFDLKSTALTVLVLLLKTPDLGLLADALAQRFGGAGGLFEQEPLCVDLSALADPDAELDFAALAALLKPYGLNAVALRGGSAAHKAAALGAGLAEAPDATPPARSAAVATEPGEAGESPAAPDQAPPPQPGLFDVPPDVAHAAGEAAADASGEPAVAALRPAAATLIIDKPLRSGQQVYARGGDLIVLAVVSHGAEVIADGSIHVYAPLRGRALAGATGNPEARIFAASMEPQLVSIAGTWRTLEAGLPPEVAGKPAQVRLDGDKLIFEPLKF